MRTLVVALIAAGCNGNTTKPPPGNPEPDADGDGFTVNEDCDDGQAMINPSAFDVWYDGVDQDCAGNDDFDQDGDGADAIDYGGDDCNDLDPTVSPTADEVLYNGVDEDCDPTTVDDDVDQDGFDHLTDCDDTDPVRFPGAAETLDDGIDQDCDGQVDQAAWGFADLTFSHPLRPILGVTADFVVLSAVAQTATDDTTTYLETYVTPGLLLSFDLDAVNGAPLAQEPLLWYGPADEDPIASQDLEVFGSTVLLGTTYYSANNDNGYQVVRPFTWAGPGVGWFQEGPSYHSEVLTAWSHVDLHLDDDGTPWLCATDGDDVGYFRGDETIASPGADLPGVDATLGCFWTDNREFTTLAADGTATTWKVDGAFGPPVVSTEQPFGADPYVGGHEQGGVGIAISADGGFKTVSKAGSITSWFDQYTFLDADLTTLGSATWIAGIADRGNGPEVLLSDGATEHWFTTSDRGHALDPTGVAVALTPDRVVIAVSAAETDGSGTDRVGWAFYPR